MCSIIGLRAMILQGFCAGRAEIAPARRLVKQRLGYHYQNRPGVS